MAVDLEPPAQDVVDAASTSAWLQDDRQEPSSPLKGRLDSFAAVDNVDNNDHAQQQPFRLPAHTFHRHVESGAMHATPTPMNARATRQRVVPVAVAQEQRQQDDADDSAAELHNLLDAVDVSEDCDDDHQASHDHSQDRMSRRLAQLSFDDDDADNAPDESFHRQHRHDGSAGPTIELDDEDMERIAAEMDKSGVSSSGGFIIGSSPVRRVASSPVRVTSSPVRQPAEFHDPLGLFGTPQVKSSAASATAAGSPHRQVLLPASSVSSPERREQRVDDNGPHHSSSRAALQRQHAQPPIATSMHSGDERKRQAHASTATRMPATAGAASLSPSVPSEYYGVLAEVRKECQHLRQLNERLMRSNEDARRALEHSMVDKERALDAVRKEYAKNVEIVEIAAERRMEQYEEHIRTIQSDLNTARNAQTQISTIREALAKEKEIDILAIKKEVLQQKERQLQALRTEMQQDKEAAQKRMREDLEHREQLAAEVQRRLQEDLDRALAQAEELRAKIKPEVSTRTVDQQTDMCGDQVVARSEYDHVVLERDAARSDRDESHGREYDLCMEKEKIQFDCHNFAERCAAMECELKEKDAAIEALRQTLASQLEKSTTGKSQTTVPLSDVEKVKAQCTEAYETAVQQLQQKYSQLEERLAAKHQSDLIRQRREIELKLRDELDLVEDQRARAAALETQLADAAKLHRKELRALESKLTGQHADAVRKVKDQYLETLRQMRDDVAASKQRSLERVRAEWERKKTDLDEAWKKRIDEMRAEYQRKLDSYGTNSQSKSPIKKSSAMKPVGSPKVHKVSLRHGRP